MKASWVDDLSDRHRAIKKAGLWRERQTLETAQSTQVVMAGRVLCNFSSNDYLGLANNDQLKNSASESVLAWGVGAGASHLVCGHSHLHHCLEQEIAEFVNAERAVLFSSGYMANLAIGSAFLTKGDLFLHDKLNHASLIDAGLASKSDFKRYAHNDLGHAQKLIDKSECNRLMVASDAVFSMDGDSAHILGLKELAEKNNALLLLDDAHGFGVLGHGGRGSLDAAGLCPQGCTLMMGTLGKAYASFGAFVAGDDIFIEHLIQSARTYIYTTALPPSVASASLSSLRYVLSQKGVLQESLNQNISYFKKQAKQHGICLMPSDTAIQPIIIGDASAASAVSVAMLAQGFLLTAIRPPTVPKGSARLRVALTAAHTKEQIDGLIRALLKPLTINSGRHE